ncbi:MAG: histone deacetylase family protein, partial [Promethearchaeota archaeon]
MKNVGIIYQDIYAKHDTGNHPECADRVIHTVKQLKENQMFGENRINHFKNIEPKKATLEQIRWSHSNLLINKVVEAVESTKKRNSHVYIDGDTVASPATFDAALYATGGNFAAIDAIFSGEIDRSFVICRPPGHHSNKDYARGFCIFNNIALSTEYLIRNKKLNRVAIVDFDAHAGNGTEDIFYSGLNQGELLFISIHQDPHTLYPGTCFMDEIGEGKQKGKIVNITLAPYSGQKSVKLAFNQIILPMLREFKPEFILCSAGFDAHHYDPLTNLGFMDQTYSYIIQELAKISEDYAKGRIQ